MELGNSSVRLVNLAAPSAPESPTSTSSYGLKSGSLSPFQTLAQSIAVIAPTGAPVMTVPLVYALAGQGCAIAFLISTIGILLVALNINQFARMSASPGSLYTYITDHMHPRWGVLAGWALLIAYIGTASAVSAGVANYADVIFRDLFGLQGFPLTLTALVTVVACFLAYRDIQISTRLMLWLQAASVALISVIAIGIIVKHGWRLDMGQLTLQGVTPQQLRLGLVLAIFSAVGFESATSLGSEARDPLINIPRAVKWSAILAGVFFFLCSYAEVLAFRGETQTLSQNAAPLHVLARQLGLPPLIGTLTDLGAVVTFFACFLACITASARVLFLMGRHGALHSELGQAHDENQTPHRAVLLASVAAFLPAAVMTLRGMNLFDIYGLIGTLATFGFVTAYILVSMAAPMYLRAQGRLTPQAIGISVLAVLAMCAALLGNLYPVPDAPYSYLPYIYAVLLLAGFGWSTVWSARTPSFVPDIAADLTVLPNETD
ncbi:MAG TPA: APC family permease [Bryobacteraceae bacterium]|jgi:amino acid transporter|nr:APC family permease [Bryobacteraceae bacterium]